MFQRFVHLSSLVNENEAICYKKLFTSKNTNVLNYAKDPDSVDFLQRLNQIFLEEAQALFGSTASTEICGSFIKGTDISTSDVDIYIHTDRHVNRKEREEFTNRLKNHNFLNEMHVHLGRLAIHVRSVIDIDLVFSKTTEYGERERADDTVADNIALQLAAKGLKHWVQAGRKNKVPGYGLERMAHAVQLKFPIVGPVHGDGGMQLFISVLQMIVDSPPGGNLMGLPSGTGSPNHLRQLARMSLHLFVVSRALNGSFRDTDEINGWISNGVDHYHIAETIAGPVPDWLVSRYGRPSTESCVVSLFYKYSVKDENMVNDDLKLKDEDLLKLFSLTISKLGHYALSSIDICRNLLTADDTTVEPLFNTKNIDAGNELRTLRLLAISGSIVAQRMFKARSFFMQGQEYLDIGDNVRGISTIASSLRLSSVDSDSFSGWFVRNADMTIHHSYLDSCEKVLEVSPSNADARLVRTMIYFLSMRFEDAEREAILGCRENPSDAFGIIYLYGLICSNQNRWSDAVLHFSNCIKVQVEPIFYYWRAISNSKIIMKSLGKNIGMALLVQVKAILNDFEYFILHAAPEGRKVCQAHYEVAYITILTKMSSLREKATQDTLIELLVRARKAETLQLSVFPPLSCDSKTQAIELISRFESSLPSSSSSSVEVKDPATSIVQLKLRGNACFKELCYLEAYNYYTKALQLDSENAEILSNRSATCAALGWYSQAVKDAQKVIMIKPDWSKGYFRLTKAFLGKKNSFGAMESITTALQYHTSDNADLIHLKEEVRILENEQEQRNFQNLPIVKNSDCWNQVMFKDRVFLVDMLGLADYCSLKDALFDCCMNYIGNFTLVLRSGQYLEEHLYPYSNSMNSGSESLNLVLSSSSSQSQKSVIQIIGWSNDSRCIIRTPGDLSNVGVSNLVPENISVLSFNGEDRCLYVENVVFQSKQYCINVTGGGTVIAKNCEFMSPSNPCFSISQVGTKAILEGCKVSKSSAAAVVGHGGSLEAKNCTISGCFKPAFEIRDHGSCATLQECNIDNCTSSAFVLYKDGKKLELTSCSIKNCGTAGGCKSAILLETGTAILRDCKVIDSPDDAIVMQMNVLKREEPPPRLLMTNCIIDNNTKGLSIHYGFGMLVGNTISNTVMMGVLIRDIPDGKNILFRNNIISKNIADLVIQGQALFERQVIIEPGNIISRQIVKSDVEAKRINETVHKKVYN